MDCPPARWWTLSVNSDGTVSLLSGIISNGRSSTASDSLVGCSIARMCQSLGMPNPSGVFCFPFDPEGVEVIIDLWGGEACSNVTVRPPCQIKSGILGFGDLRQDYKDGFWREVIPKGEIDHVRCHVTERLMSEDYTSQTWLGIKKDTSTWSWDIEKSRAISSEAD